MNSSVIHELQETCEFCNCFLGTGNTIGCRTVRINHILYSLLCIVITVIEIIICISIAFVVLLNCRYLNQSVLLFVHSPPFPTEEKVRG